MIHFLLFTKINKYLFVRFYLIYLSAGVYGRVNRWYIFRRNTCHFRDIINGLSLTNAAKFCRPTLAATLTPDLYYLYIIGLILFHYRYVR